MSNNRFRMISCQPAIRWQDALPTGNGQIGAMDYGHIRNNRILLNHDSNWHRLGTPKLADISERLPELRSMLAKGQYQEANDFLQNAMTEAGGKLERPAPYQPQCDLALFTQTKGAFSDYSREVDFTSGVVTVAWTDEEIRFERSLFVSRVDDVVVMRITANQPEQVTGHIAVMYHGEGQSVGMESVDELPATFSKWREDGWLGINGQYKNGDEFGAIARIVVNGGSSETKDNRVSFQNADSLLLLVKLFANEKASIANSRQKVELTELSTDYDILLKRHSEKHRELFCRMSLDLDAGDERNKSNEQLLLEAYNGEVSKALIERMFFYGRYLLICSSSPESLPANLQGVWNGDYQPPWSSDYHNDENIQMNYWQALPGNIPEVTLPYFKYFESHVPQYQQNAMKLYGCRGIFVPIAQSTHGFPHPGVWLNWTAGAGWLAQLFYDYWLFTGDREFLEKRTVPFLREVALFYEDFLFEGENGQLVFSPSLSPENVPSTEGASMTCINATMDVAVAREVLNNLCQACELLEINSADVIRWREMLEKLPDYEINEDGAIREWLWPGLNDNYRHRHQSHIYPLFPGIEVTEESKPELFCACRTAVEKRLIIGLSSQTGWSLVHMANIYARLGDGERAVECLNLLTRSCVGTNLLTYHNDWRGQGLTLGGGPGHIPPFQIDANFGLSAAILEMLVFSAPGMIKLLPALPKCWKKGRAEGIACRGGVIVDLQWDMDTKNLRATLRAKEDLQLTLKLPENPTEIDSEPAIKITESPIGKSYQVISLPANQPVRLEISLV